MKIVERKISELRPAEYNPRRLTQKQYKSLRESMEELGHLGVAVVNQHKGRENVIISGHQRIKIARDMGHKVFPCIEVSFPPEQEKRANLRLNKNQGEWDFDILANEFELEELAAVGFDEEEEVHLKPFKRTHVLLSFSPELMIEIQDKLDAIRGVEGVELEIGSN